MPTLSGLDVLEELAAADVRPAFIITTAFANDDTRSRTERLGGLLLEKPVGLSILRAAVAVSLTCAAR